MFTSNAPDSASLQLLMDAAQIGWWKADYQTGEVLLSDYLTDLLGLEQAHTNLSELIPFIREDYRQHIHELFLKLREQNAFDVTFPMIVPEGEIWVHLQLVRRQSDPARVFKLFGYMQRVPVHDAGEAERLTLDSRFHAERRKNRHMDEILDHLPIGYVRLRMLYDDNGTASDYLFLSLNQTVQQMLNLDAEKYIGRTAREVGIDEIDHHIELLAPIRQGKYVKMEWHAETTDRYCRSFLYNTPNDETEIIILILDITDRIRAHRALDAQRKLLSDIIRNAPVGVEIYNRDGWLIDVNDCAMEMFGVERAEDMLGISFFDNPNISAEDKERVRNSSDQGVDLSQRYDLTAIGSYFPHTIRRNSFDWTARIRRLCDSEGELTHYLVIDIDNTELRQSQHRIAEFETLFSLVSEYAHVGYANYNLATNDGYAQNVWLHNYGEQETATIAQVVGRYDHLHPEDREKLIGIIDDFRSGRITSATMPCRIRHDDGRTTWIKTHILCRDFRPEAGIIDMVGVNYDITNLKKTEAALIAAKERAEESNKLKSAFLANMSHEIRTPLNAIVGFSELLASEEDSTTRQEYIDIISQNNSLLLQIISDVLDLSRIESGKSEILRTDFDARDLCREAVDSLRMQCPSEVELRLEGGLASLLLCEYKQGLLQVLGNFARNALKFTHRGSVTIGFDALPEQVRFYVRDTGIGIPADQLPHIFDRFYKIDTFTQGTGLGLSICKSIAEQLNGTIGVESVVGAGSCFWIRIPLRPAAVEA